MKLLYRQQAIFIVDALYGRSSSTGVSLPPCQNKNNMYFQGQRKLVISCFCFAYLN